jgi:hypothetical protein
MPNRRDRSPALITVLGVRSDFFEVNADMIMLQPGAEDSPVGPGIIAILYFYYVRILKAIYHSYQ